VTTCEICLKRRGDGQTVTGTLYEGLSQEVLIEIDLAWGEERQRIKDAVTSAAVPSAERPQTLHWSWSAKAGYLDQLEATAFGIEVQGSWQAIMLTRTASHVARIDEDENRPLVYVDYVEAAPWNWRIPAVGQVGTYQLAGTVMLTEAVMQSMREGFHGRMALHSLPQSEGFYERIGMTNLGPDLTVQGLTYFEFSRSGASRFVSGEVSDAQ